MSTPIATGEPQTLHTGIELLDTRLDGGLFAGSIVALQADPSSQSEILLSRLARERPTLYLTFQRTTDAVRRGLVRQGVDVDTVDVHAVGPAEPFETAASLIADVSEPTTVIVDPANVIESRDDEQLWTFLNESHAHLVDVGGLLVLHCLTGEPAPAGRVTTTYMADTVFDLETNYGWETIENRLVVPKLRGGRPIEQALKLQLTDDVMVDTSRDIA